MPKEKNLNERRKQNNKLLKDHTCYHVLHGEPGDVEMQLNKLHRDNKQIEMLSITDCAINIIVMVVKVVADY